MNARFTIRLVYIVAIAVCVIIAAIAILAADPLYLRAPDDRTLLAAFRAHRDAFEKIRVMVTEDERIANYFSERTLDERIGEARQREYRRLLAEIRPGLVVRSSARSVRFIFASGGLLAIGPGWLKGIEYVPPTTDRAGIVVKSLDRPRALSKESVSVVPIQANWYLVFQQLE